MSGYQAPVDDMRFVIDDLCGVAGELRRAGDAWHGECAAGSIALPWPD